MFSVQETMSLVQQRARTDNQFASELEAGLRDGGLVGAAHVARAHGFDIPDAWLEAGGELSDLELELVTAGKSGGFVRVGVGFGGGYGYGPFFGPYYGFGPSFGWGYSRGFWFY